MHLGQDEEDYVSSSALPETYEDIDYENLSEFLSLQLQDVDTFLNNRDFDSHGFGDRSTSVPHTSSSSLEPVREGEAGKKGEHFMLGLLRQALALNRKYQQHLRDQLIMTTEGQKMTRDIQRWLRTLQAQLKRRRRNTLWGSWYGGASFLVDSQGCIPPDNDEAIQLRTLLIEYGKAMRHSVRWTEKERAGLAKGIRHLNQAVLVDRIVAGTQTTMTMDQRELENDSIFSSLAAASAALPTTLSHPRTSRYQQAVSSVQRMPQHQLELNLNGIDWAKIATLFIPTRSPDDCRIQWTCNQHPLISHAPFTREERSRLMAIVNRRRGITADKAEKDKEKEKGGWIEIAEELGSNRTAWQCLAEFRAEEERQNSLSKSLAARKWSAEEDRILGEGVLMYGTTDAWSEISETLDGRTPAQCVHRWTKTLDPTKRTGRWSSLEDAWLQAALRRVGSLNWSLVQQFVPNRTDVQCRERYINVLDPALLHQQFSPKEDEQLTRAVEQHGEGKWSLVVEMLPGRTDNQCRRRWLYLQAQESKRKRPKRKAGRPRKS